MYQSPCGAITLGARGGRLCVCAFAASAERDLRRVRAMKGLGVKDGGCDCCVGSYDTVEDDEAVLHRAVEWLDGYFLGCKEGCDLPLEQIGTEFQRLVWEALLAIPYGVTRSYGQIAEMIGRPRSVRAVAQAIGANHLSIFVPCHRVVGADGTLTGYAGGLPAKRALLALEGKFRKGDQHRQRLRGCLKIKFNLGSQP